MDERSLSGIKTKAERLAGSIPGWAILTATVLLLALLVIFLRAVNLHQAFDIFLDEITYLFLSQSVSANEGVRLHGETFYLHPPVFFYLESAFLKLITPSGDLVQQVYAVRPLNVLLAGASGAMIFLIGRSVAGAAAGILAAVIYALDPLSVRLGGRNMLEVAAVFWVLAGLLIILPLVSGDERKPFSWWRVAAGGILFGLAMLTKDMMVFLTLLPLVICIVLKRCLSQRTALSIGLVAVLVYAIYPLGVLLSGDFPRFLEKKADGLLRLVGLAQETGFNRPEGPGLFSSLFDKLGEFGPTYLLFAVGVVALVYILRRADAKGRFMAIWAAGAYALLAYLIPVGTLETQFFYYLVVPAALASSIAAVLLFRQEKSGAISFWLRPAAAAVLVLILLWSSTIWVLSRSSPDNGYERVLTFVEDEIPPEMRVASTSETGQFLLDERASGPWGIWYSLETLVEHQPDYLIVSQRQLEWDYGDLAIPLEAWLQENGQPVFSFSGRTNEQLVVYYLPPESWGTLPSGIVGNARRSGSDQPAGSSPSSVFSITAR